MQGVYVYITHTLALPAPHAVHLRTSADARRAVVAGHRLFQLSFLEAFNGIE